jgi:hypothetical protein
MDSGDLGDRTTSQSDGSRAIVVSDGRVIGGLHRLLAKQLADKSLVRLRHC